MSIKLTAESDYDAFRSVPSSGGKMAFQHRARYLWPVRTQTGLLDSFALDECGE